MPNRSEDRYRQHFTLAQACAFICASDLLQSPAGFVRENRFWLAFRDARRLSNSWRSDGAWKMPEMARADLGVVDSAVRGLRRLGLRPDDMGLRVSTSRSAVLRLLGALPEAEVPSPRVVGVDEYATRKGRVYGTVLVDAKPVGRRTAA
jgi:hypothetical protein